MIRTFTKIFGSRAKAQEIVLLLDDTKEVVRQGFYPEELPAVERFCKRNKIHPAVSRYRVLLSDHAPYSNQGIILAENDLRRGMHFVYFSKDEKKAMLACVHETMGNHTELGLLLGYPRCCVNFFVDNFNAQQADPAHLPTNAYTNLTRRQDDYVILSHFPCNSNCAESVLLGRKYIDALYKDDRTYAAELLEALQVELPSHPC